MNNEHPMLAKLRTQLAQKAQTWAELQEKIKQRIAERAAEQAKQDNGGE